MALPESGLIKFSDINTELGLSPNAQLSMGNALVRTLFGVSSGAISMNQGYNKSNRVARTIVLSSNRDTYNLRTSGVSGYVAGKTDVTLEISTGVYLYSVLTSQAALIVEAFASGDTISIVNNGYILGKGGAGGSSGNGGAGGPAVTLSYPVTITNNSYIAGGGGGGGGMVNSGTVAFGGGGGAGGGAGGTGTYGGPGTGGTPGSAGTNGSISTYGSGGGGGGRILPGVGGSSVVTAVGPPISGADILPGLGGGSGGSGGAGTGGPAGPIKVGVSGFGGNANVAGGSASYNGIGGGGGGGGGWGAAGGNGNVNAGTSYVGGAGGKAINLNGYTATILVTGTIYGAIS